MKMSDVDVLIESTISEAPVGMISRGVKKLLGKLPGDIGDKATGQLQVGEFANQLKKDYSYFLGKTGYERSRESLKVFLDQTGLSDAALDTAISSTTGGSTSGATNQDWRILPQGDEAKAAEQEKQQAASAERTANQPTVVRNPLANMGKGYVPPSPEPLDDITGGTKPEPVINVQQEPSKTGNNAAAALNKIKTSRNSMKGTHVEPVVSSPEDKDTSVDNKVSTSPEDTDTSVDNKVSTTTSKKAKQQSKPQIGTERSDAAKRLKDNTEVDAAHTKAKRLVGQYSLTKNAELKAMLKLEAEKAIAELDAAIAKNQNTAPSSKFKPVDHNSLSSKLSTAIAANKKGEGDGVPDDTNTATDTSEEDDTRAKEIANATAEFNKAETKLKPYEMDTAKKKNHNAHVNAVKAYNDAGEKLAKLDGNPFTPKEEPAKKSVSMKDPTDTVKNATGTKKPVSTNQSEIPFDAESADTTDDAAETDTTPSAANVDDSDIANIPTVETVTDTLSTMDAHIERLGKKANIPQWRIDSWYNARDDLYTLQQSIKMANRIRASLDAMKADIDNSKGANKANYQKKYDEKEDAYNEQKKVVQVNYENYNKSKDAAMEKTGEIENASINHQYDFILAEDELTNKQVDKILLAVAQDNVRKNIVDLGRRPTTSKKPATQPSGRSSGSSSSSSSAPSYSSGSTGSSQYTQQAQQKAGGKTLDLSDFNVERLISAINHILKKEELQRFEERQLEKLMRELKAVREGRAMQEANTLTEAPMGLGQRLATGVASKFSSQAAGKLDAGKIANQYKPEYSRWLGTTGANPDAQSLIDFFQSKRLDTSKIQQIADSVAPNATRLTGQQLDSIIMQITQENIRNGKITPGAAAQASGQPAATQSTLPVMAQRMLTDPAVQSHPEYVRFLSGLK